MRVHHRVLHDHLRVDMYMIGSEQALKVQVDESNIYGSYSYYAVFSFSGFVYSLMGNTHDKETNERKIRPILQMVLHKMQVPLKVGSYHDTVFYATSLKRNNERKPSKWQEIQAMHKVYVSM